MRIIDNEREKDRKWVRIIHVAALVPEYFQSRERAREREREREKANYTCNLLEVAVDH